MIKGAVPVKLLNPAWQVALTSVLDGQAPIALMGLALLYFSVFLDLENPRLQARIAWVGKLAILASVGFLLLNPPARLQPLEPSSGRRQRPGTPHRLRQHTSGADTKRRAQRQQQR